MNDINCKQCGEPYSAYALRHDVAEWDDQPDDAYDKFMRGEGCPTCNWGEKAGEVSTSRFKNEDELTTEHLKGIFENTDDDPIKYI